MSTDRLKLAVQSFSLVLRIVNDSVVYIKRGNTVLVFTNALNIFPKFLSIYFSICITGEQIALIFSMSFTDSTSYLISY